MIARNVATSAKVALVSWFTEALWLRGIPFCDDAGMMDADPEEVKTLLMPRGKKGKQISLKQIEGALEELQRVELTTLHTCEYQTCQRYVNFEKFQTLKAGRALQIDCKNPGGIQCLPLESIGIHWNPEESNYFPNAREESNGNPVRARGSEVNGSKEEKEVKGSEAAQVQGQDPETNGSGFLSDPRLSQAAKKIVQSVGIPQEIKNQAADETARKRRRT